ncbi:hypothetical protein Bphy_7104 (plasmid) [Paraburkholderia phymatum STM815]|uniref:Uncharacterized protein n=1 Tax=Paraburkholderia phymatum (strain DSM 17167 / CIP 108236 / LMG 21445 / STM815) TaxID=391038 RepID=B2JU53_PARP8|nr:hypothetical protein Bphy_7104 [Paraburkholderia phymatum STM815]
MRASIIAREKAAINSVWLIQSFGRGIAVNAPFVFANAPPCARHDRTHGAAAIHHSRTALSIDGRTVATALAIALPPRFFRIAARFTDAVVGPIVFGVLIGLRKRGYGRGQADQTHDSKNKRKGLHSSPPCSIVAMTIDRDRARPFANVHDACLPNGQSFASERD